VREIRRTTSARHRGQRKIGISKLAGILIREVARELEEDMDLDSRPPGAAGDLNASGQGQHRPLDRPRSVGVADDRALCRRLRATSKRHSPSTPPSRSPAPGSWLPTGIDSHLCAWLISTHRCELRQRVPALLSPLRMVRGPTATGSHTPRRPTVWSSSHAWSHLIEMSQPPLT
jgi:hypothetical protein